MRRKIIGWILLSWCGCSLVWGTELGTDGTHFTVNGKRTFLLGISYFAALGAPTEFVQKDLDDMQRDGFNWIRVWANWGAFGTNVAAFQMDGTSREPFFGRLRSLLAECDRRGMIVDLTLARENGAKEPPGLSGLPEHRRAVETLIQGLQKYRNWYLDLANERNVRDQRFVSLEELKTLRDRGKDLDGKRLITASHSSDDGDLMGHLEPYLKTVRLDFIAQHRSRSPGAAQETQSATVKILQKMKELGAAAPVLYQEPFRRGYGDWQPKADDFLADLRGAIQGGAAGWCFRNGSQRESAESLPRRSFDLRAQRLYDQLDPVEKEVAQALKTMTPKP